MGLLRRLVAPGVFVLGAALIAEALRTGGAQVELVVVVPVVTGSSLAFGAGVLALVAGFLLLPWTFEGPEPAAPPPTGTGRGW